MIHLWLFYAWWFHFKLCRMLPVVSVLPNQGFLGGIRRVASEFCPKQFVLHHVKNSMVFASIVLKYYLICLRYPSIQQEDFFTPSKFPRNYSYHLRVNGIAHNLISFHFVGALFLFHRVR